VIRHLPFISVDEVGEILKRKKNADVERYRAMEEEQEQMEQTPQQEQEEQPTEQVE
jgi:hypothetical protein